MIDLENVFDLIISADGTDEDGDKYRFNKYNEKEWIFKWEQYKTLQRFAFKLDNCKVNISQTLADFLNEKYDRLMIEVEEEKEIDLSGDYIMDFNCWVKGKEDTPKCWC